MGKETPFLFIWHTGCNGCNFLIILLWLKWPEFKWVTGTFSLIALYGLEVTLRISNMAGDVMWPLLFSSWCRAKKSGCWLFFVFYSVRFIYHGALVWNRGLQQVDWTSELYIGPWPSCPFSWRLRKTVEVRNNWPPLDGKEKSWQFTCSLLLSTGFLLANLICKGILRWVSDLNKLKTTCLVKSSGYFHVIFFHAKKDLSSTPVEIFQSGYYSGTYYRGSTSIQTLPRSIHGISISPKNQAPLH